MPTLPILLNVLVAGIAIGSIYAMMSIGFSLLWQTSRTVNFAQGDFATVPGFVLFGMAVSLGLPLGLAVVVTIAVSVVVLGYLFRKIIIAKLLTKGVLAIVVASLALSILIQNGFLVFWTPTALNPPALIPGSPIRVGDVILNARDLTNLLVAAAMIVGLQFFLRYTKPGKALQATAQNANVARILGIDTERMITLAFAINAALVAVAAILLVPIFFVKYNIGLELGLRAFFAAIIGGFNRVRGALVGGLIVGVLETFTAAFISTQYRTGVVLAFLIAVILAKPEGLLGEKELVTEYQG